MVDQDISRKLAVIVHTDVVDSTALVQRDEILAHKRITETFQRFSSIIRDYGGTVHEIRGDALVAEFARASDAACAALSFQHAHTEHLLTLSDEIKPAVRIGVSLGEVVFADNTVTGAGVVMAQRVEQLAEPGSVYITGAIHEALPQHMPFDQENLGEQQVKGFDEPLRVYRVELTPGESIPPSQGSSQREASTKTKRLIVAVAAIALIVAGGVITWFKPWQPKEERVSVEGMAFPLPDKPSIAVLPFTNMSGDPQQEYFSDGITEDLITDLSKISGLFVIARNTTFAYKGKSPDVRRVAKELGVRYVLEGSVRKGGQQLRINTQLIDGSTGGHVWADRYDGNYEDVFALQDKVTSKIVATLAVRLTAGEQERIDRKETESMEAYDTFLKGWEQYLRQRPESFRQAIALFEKAAELDTGYSRAYAALSATYWQAWKRYWHNALGFSNPHDIRFKAEEFLVKAMKQPTPLALQVSTAMLAQQGRHDEAVAEGERAVAMDPNDPDGYVALAGALNLAGKPDKALPLMEQAIRLNLHYPTSYLYELGLVRFGMEEFDEAALALERAVTLNPDDRWASRLLIATLGHLGLAGEAAAAIDKAEANWRGFDPLSVRGVAFWYPFQEPADAERLADGLRKAGVPD